VLRNRELEMTLSPARIINYSEGKQLGTERAGTGKENKIARLQNLREGGGKLTSAKPLVLFLKRLGKT